ncbi:DUF2254 domain-containing protein [Egicoccus sp. AB-alg6-2]|uniref:DUF2254 domain-containing protein n=1 Tax=Egicoccus sp. AB-alg6-2 TaxID=3242692 RepID=UPI00359F0AD8
MNEVLVRLRGSWQDLQDSLWLFPALGVFLSVAVAWILVTFEPTLERLPSALTYTGSADGARAILAELAGATFTVVGVVFSLTVVALQMASSQFTPRLLRTFLKDRSVQVVLSGMVSSGVFHVVVLRYVRTPDGGEEPFVPELAVSVALLFALVAVGMLVFFLHHLTSRLRVDDVMASIRKQTLAVLDSLAVDREMLPDQVAPTPPAEARPVVARTSGYLQTASPSALSATAEEHDLVVCLRPKPGQWVAAGTTVAWVWPVDDGEAVEVDDDLAAALHRCFHLGRDRTESDDVAFGLRQLSDIAARALSTGVNDPTTCVQALGQLSTIMVALADQPLGAALAYDADGRLRAVQPRPTFAEHLELAITQPRRYGASEPTVLIAVLELLIDVAERVADSGDRAASVRHQLRRTLAAAELPDDADVRTVRAFADAVAVTLDDGVRPANIGR